MIRKFSLSLAAASALFAVPLAAQDEPEEPRTTYEIRLVDLAPGAGGDWNTMYNEHFAKAREAAGLPAIEVHWMNAGPWDLMLLMPMPGGMAAMDTHNPAGRTAFDKALLAQEGSEDAVKALYEKADKLVSRSASWYSHTHP